MPPRIAVVSALLHPRYGGPSSVVRHHVQWLSRRAEVRVVGVSADTDEEALRLLYPGAMLCRPGFPARWHYGIGLSKALASVVSQVDLVHVHMLWDHAVYSAWRASRSQRKKLIITPHGALVALSRQRAIQKRIYRRFILNSVFQEGTCLHVLSDDEGKACREYGVHLPTYVIPNALPVSLFENQSSPGPARDRWGALKDRRAMLYLGRIGRGKGLDLLVDAWRRTREIPYAKDWLLVVAGPDYRNYRTILEQRIAVNGVADSIMVVGAVDDPLKSSLVAASSCLVLPSLGEAFSMSILEAMAARVPVLYTDHCRFPDLAAAGGGWEVSADGDALTAAISTVLAARPADLRNAGECAWRLGRERYTMETVGPQLLQMYNDVVGSGPMS